METPTASNSFRPPFYLRHPFVQTFLGSLRLKRPAHKPLVAGASPLVLTTAQGTRLKGLLSRAGLRPAKGTVILLHGWEGSSGSSYVLNAGAFLLARGFDIFRLNLRDHGDSHALNQGMFYATLLDETYDAFLQAARLAEGGPVFLCGFSLGGNFALRIARCWSRAPQNGIDLRHVIAVSPVLDPDRATTAVDSHPLIRSYFIGKWKRSLATKQSLFPELYNFEPVLKYKTVRSMTDALLKRFSEYPDAQAYFAEYNLCGDALASIDITTTIITAEDDPIIPVDDFRRLTLPGAVQRLIQPYGGHNGFLPAIRGARYHDMYMQKCFEARTNA
ncbi:MAG: alpha/beta fold hydrolase [Desulfosarcinaceae bacterium]